MKKELAIVIVLLILGIFNTNVNAACDDEKSLIVNAENINLNEDVIISPNDNGTIYYKINVPQNALVEVLVNDRYMDSGMDEPINYNENIKCLEGGEIQDVYSSTEKTVFGNYGAKYTFLKSNKTYYYKLTTSKSKNIKLRINNLFSDAIETNGIINDTITSNFRKIYRYKCKKSGFCYGTPVLKYKDEGASAYIVIFDEKGHSGEVDRDGKCWGELFSECRDSEYIYILIQTQNHIFDTGFLLDLKNIDSRNEYTHITNLSVKNKKGNKIFVSWNQIDDNVTRYLVQIAKNKKMKRGLKNYSCKRKTFTKKLKRGTYYVRVRTVDGGVIGKWSNIVKVKVKK